MAVASILIQTGKATLKGEDPGGGVTKKVEGRDSEGEKIIVGVDGR